MIDRDAFGPTGGIAARDGRDAAYRRKRDFYLVQDAGMLVVTVVYLYLRWDQVWATTNASGFPLVVTFFVGAVIGDHAAELKHMRDAMRTSPPSHQVR